jgi:hypothetical protein
MTLEALQTKMVTRYTSSKCIKIGLHPVLKPYQHFLQLGHKTICSDHCKIDAQHEETDGEHCNIASRMHFQPEMGTSSICQILNNSRV